MADARAMATAATGRSCHNPGGHVACSFRSKLPLFVLVHSGFITD